MSRNGMVATSQTLATQVGVDILKNGGNAIDAAIAANAALSLAEPHMCGLGGDLFALVWDPQAGQLQGLNASGRSSRNFSLAAMRSALGDAQAIPGRGPFSVTVPGAVAGWCALHERYGRLSLADIFAPIIAYAEEGIAIGTRTAEMWQQSAEAVVADPALAGMTQSFTDTFVPDGKSPRAGQKYCNPDLASSFRSIGAGGRDAFYTGELAGRIVDCLAAAGSKISLEDLAASSCDWVTPLTTHYRGYDVFELPPNGQGMSVLQILNVLERYPIREYGQESADYWHAFIEAKKLTFEDRARYYADPEFANVPVAELLAPSYAATRAGLIDDNVAGADYAHGDVVIQSGDTTYLTVADSDGLMVSLIQSLFSPFGSGLVPPGSGFALQCRGAGFTLDPGHPNVYAPQKRPFHTIIPAFVMKDGQPWMSFGVMGADMQPQGQVQVLVNMIDFDMDPQAAADAPRMRHFGGSQPNGARLDGLGVVQYEAEFPPALIEELTRRGHRMQVIDDWIEGFVGGYQAIQYRADDGVYIGGSEPRLDGCAIGY